MAAVVTDFPQVLIDAARFERDSRAERYPALVEGGRLDADEATVSYQCWCAIAGWFETGRFESIAGGLDGKTIVDWAACEAAAERALVQIRAKAEKLAEGDPAFADTHRRRGALVCIHRAVQLRRQTIDRLNRELRERAIQSRHDAGDRRRGSYASPSSPPSCEARP